MCPLGAIINPALAGLQGAISKLLRLPLKYGGPGCSLLAADPCTLVGKETFLRDFLACV